jgi:hypothetical protein
MSYADLGFGRFSRMFDRSVGEDALSVEPFGQSYRVFEVTGLHPFRGDQQLLLRMDLQHVADVRDLLDLSLSLQPAELERYVVLTDGRGTVFLIDRDEFDAYRRLWLRHGVNALTPDWSRSADRVPVEEE